MSTDYELSLSSSDGTTARITIVDSLNPLPGSDTWTAADNSQWEVNGGTVTSWGSGGAYLSGPVGVQSIFLDGFEKSTKAKDTGDGEKNYEGGTFPAGSFRWRCTSTS
ncbi:hypothetical protein JSE7799_02908 [Jannaschia seosinensis]|uniref:Uncharacterized protein n=1 Tax=Jannaschia seosinensis TaxID=313367 RepID=A0A0M7BDN4_9RHOB|nr:hypothetical protein JSE7799_02908 [Jannaschia seosinensis]